MASYRITFGYIRQSPDAATLGAALAAYGLPDDDEFGVLNANVDRQAAWATLVQTTVQDVTRLDRQAGELVGETIEKAKAIPMKIIPGENRLEVYAGPASIIETVQVFFAGGAALPVVIEPITIDIPGAVEKLASRTKRFQLKKFRTKTYCHNSYMSGPYAPKFLDNQHGQDFMEEYAEKAAAATVRFQMPSGPATVHLSPTASFSYSVKDENDVEAIQKLLRELL